MKGRHVLGLMLLTILMFLAVRSGLARGTQPGDLASPAVIAPWSKIEVDTPNNTGLFTSVAINPSNGGTYISYYDATDKALRMAMNRGFGSGNCGPDNDWLCQTVDSGPDVGKYSSIAINPANGEVGIAYYDATNGKLKYAHAAICAVCSWSIVSIDKGLLFPLANAGQYASLKYHWDGTPTIAYYFENTSGVDELKVAYPKSSSGNCGHDAAAGKWQCDSVDAGDGVGQYASLAIDATGTRHVAYYDAGNGDLWYARSGFTGGFCGPGGSWLCYPVSSANDVGQYASLYVDKNKHFHIAYYDATVDALYYAVDKGSGGNCGVLGSAQCNWITNMPAGYHPMGVSMVESASGKPIIAYQSANGSLYMAQSVLSIIPSGVSASGNCGPGSNSWYCERVDRNLGTVPHRHGDYVSIALNSDGLATIAYYGFITSSDGNLKVAHQYIPVPEFQTFLPVVISNQ